MNSKPVMAVVACVIAIAGCSKSEKMQTTASQPPPQVQAEPFHGEVYKTLDGQSVLTLVSPTECELSENGTNYLCQYTKPDGALRVILTSLGTTRVVYFRLTPKGLQTNEGIVMLSPGAFAEAQAGIQRAQAEMQLARQREQDAADNARRETQTVSTHTLAPETSESPSKLVLTDTSLKVSREEKAWTIYFADIASIDKPYGIAIGGYGFYVYSYDPKITAFSSKLACFFRENSEADARMVHSAIVDAYNAWASKFPRYSRLEKTQ